MSVQLRVTRGWLPHVKGSLGMGRVGLVGPRSLGTHCPQLPLVTEVLASAQPTATRLAIHISPSGCPPCVSQLASSRSFTWQLTAPLFKKKKKRREKKFFFLPLQKAQGLGERGRADAETPALGSGLSSPPTPWTPGFHSRSPVGSQRLPLLDDSVKGTLGLPWSATSALTTRKTWAQRE